MNFAEREQLWPRLEECGEKEVRELLAENQFKTHEEEEVQEWLARRAAVDALKKAEITKWAAIISAIAAVVAAMASVLDMYK